MVDELLVNAVDGLWLDDLLVDGLLFEDAIASVGVVLGDGVKDFGTFFNSSKAANSRVFDLACFEYVSFMDASLSPLNASRLGLAW